MKTYRVTKFFDFSSYLKGSFIRSLSIGYDGAVYALLVPGEPGSFHHSTGPLTKNKEPVSYRVVALNNEGVVTDVSCEPEEICIDKVQPLPGRRLALLCSRSGLEPDGSDGKNLRIYDVQGNLEDSFSVTDDVSAFQTTDDGLIWIGNGDEGHWGPVLAAWNSKGEKLFDCSETGEIEELLECLTLNVDKGGNAWMLHWDDCRLYKIGKAGLIESWSTPAEVHLSRSLASHDNLVAFAGGHKKEKIVICDLKDGKCLPIGHFELLSSDGGSLGSRLCDGRHGKLIFSELRQKPGFFPYYSGKVFHLQMKDLFAPPN